MKYEEKVLVIEDDAQIRKFIGFALESEGFSYLEASTAKDGISHMLSEPIDILILDLGLPDMDGTEVIRKVREWSEMPIIVVSARDQDKEKVSALDLGADDYLTKPFSAAELMARVRVVHRHLRTSNRMVQQAVLSVGDLTIDLDKRIVTLKGEELHVTPMEYSLLKLLFKNIGKVMTTGSIIKEIWGTNYGTDTQALRALMAGLRRKIEDNPAKPQYILTEVGVGYRLVDEITRPANR